MSQAHYLEHYRQTIHTERIKPLDYACLRVAKEQDNMLIAKLLHFGEGRLEVTTREP